ncbi:MAG: putative sulfate exporter family transporter [Acidobacteriaceae bacterium]|nr:putative sulfate exporter family transporter [Acidobacteriaceae bacterium]MBV9779461.1 putative sulfate exporter family transporter [Acidobacteriaceae bacterium]
MFVKSNNTSKNLFFLALILTASGLVSPPLALLSGLIYGFCLEHPFHLETKRLAKFLLQVSVVSLGFGMNLQDILQAGRSGFLYTAASIIVAMSLGLGLGSLIRVDKKSAFLISTGTAICGGSAIAAVGPIADANEEEMAVSLGTIFVLNSVALFLFPVIGVLFHLNQEQFGLWSALAIHDTSSVVGTTARYGPTALAIGTTIKLARALWILPLSLLVAALLKRRPKNGERSNTTIQWPRFILLFCLAALLKSLLPAFNSTFAALNHLGKVGLTATLFLIGTGLNQNTLKRVGFRPLLQGLALWIVVGTGTLALILFNWIHV